MKSLEIILRLLDQLLTAIKFRKTQNDRDAIEQDPSAWFSNHFNGGVSDASSVREANETDSKNNSSA